MKKAHTLLVILLTVCSPIYAHTQHIPKNRESYCLQMQQLEAEFDALKREYSLIMKVHTKTVAELKDAKTRLEHSSKKLSATQNCIESLNAKVRWYVGLDKQLSEQRTLAHHLRKEVDTLTKQKADLEQAIDQLILKGNDLQIELDTLRTQNLETEELRAMISSLEGDNARLIKELRKDDEVLKAPLMTYVIVGAACGIVGGAIGYNSKQ